MSFDKIKKIYIYVYIHTISYHKLWKTNQTYDVCNLSYMMYLNYVIDLNILVYTSKQCMHK